MIRRLLFAAALVVGSSAAMIADQNVTLVLKNGQNVSGNLSYGGGNDFIVGGNRYAQNDIAVIEFVSGDPSAAELRQLPSSDHPPELERHAIVMRDGSVVRGKLYNISSDGGTVTINTTSTDRRDISSGSIARIYMSGTGARSVFNRILAAPAPAPAPAAVATTGVLSNGVIVNANQPWTDTGVNVQEGDQISFRPSGQIRLASGDDPRVVTGPDGSRSLQLPNAVYPVRGMAVGGLIGKVGNSAPFQVGNNTQPIRMPANGRLYLGINDDNFADNSGAFTVAIMR